MSNKVEKMQGVEQHTRNDVRGIEPSSVICMQINQATSSFFH